MILKPVVTAGSVAVLALLQAACFSDRPAPTTGDDCISAAPSRDGEAPGVVVIRDFSFNGQVLRVPRGSAVRWVNCDSPPHALAADDGAWTSPLMSRGQSFTREFPNPGRYLYYCEPHPFMRGEVIVDE